MTARTIALWIALIGSAARLSAQPCPGDCDISGDVGFSEVAAAVQIGLDATRLVSCTPADADNDGVVNVEDIVRNVDRAGGGCARQQQAFVVATDYETGSFAIVGLDAPRPVLPSSPSRRIGGDAVVRSHAGVLYVLNRRANNIQAFDSGEELTPLFQCSTGSNTNPHDIAVVSPRKAYVTAYESTRLLIVNPSPQPDCGDFVSGAINLSELADADGIPEMDQMVLVGDRLFVSLEQLDRRNLFAPARKGILVEIDTEHDAVVGSIELSGANPFASTKGLPVVNGDIVIAETGRFGVNDGGIERVDLASHTASGFFISEEDLGGDLNDFVILSARLGYAAVSGESSTKVVGFDPSQRRVLRTVYDRGGFVPDIEVNDRGELFVSDRTFSRPGLRIYRATDGVELTTGVLPVGLPPFDLVFLP